MSSISFTITFLFSFISTWIFSTDAQVFMVLMEDDAVVMMSLSNSEDFAMYKEQITKKHDTFLESLLEEGSYSKLYSYTHLLNGFAIYVEGEEVFQLLQSSDRVRSIYEDIKVEKCTTHTPDLLGLTKGAWPMLGGSSVAGAGVVIGLIDTGINHLHPSFASQKSGVFAKNTKFRGKCVAGENFPPSACNGKIVGAHYFAKAAIAAGEFNSSGDYASPFDVDGHGSHTASIAAGNHNVPVIVNNFNHGCASGMAPGARIAVYKAMSTFGGYISDVVAAIDQAVEDGVDIISLSIGPTTVPTGPTAFLSVLELALLFATKAGVLVVQSVGNDGPSPSSVLSFSPWINSVAASLTDRTYNNSLSLGNGHSLRGIGIAPPTNGGAYFKVISAADACQGNITESHVNRCQSADLFIRFIARGKIIICTYTFDFLIGSAEIGQIADTVHRIGAAGFILTMGSDINSDHINGIPIKTFRVPGIILNNRESSAAMWEYYNSSTIRMRNGRTLLFRGAARILDGRRATYTDKAPIVASYSSRGPDVNNAYSELADVLKPNILAPGSSIWAAWSPNSEGDEYSKGQNFALLSGTSMATPHIAGIAALIKQKHPHWSPAAITSAMMTSADITDISGSPIQAQVYEELSPASPFDFGAGSINPSKAIDPGLVFDAYFENYVQFLCALPDIDAMYIRRAIGIGCPVKGKEWCSDLNTASVIISNLIGSRKVIRRVTNVGVSDEKYKVIVREPVGVKITVMPHFFTIGVNSSIQITLVLEATKMMYDYNDYNQINEYTFGEMVLKGNKNHVIRVPIGVLVSN